MTDLISRVLERKGHHVETTTLDTTASAAVLRMNARRIGSLVVLDGVRIAGIFTERDVLVRVVAAGLEPRTTAVGHVMTRDPITIRPTTTVADAMRVINDQRCRHLPVVDGRGLCGLISHGDLTSWLIGAQQRTIHDLEDFIRAA
ncbi:MAG: CBS domain-containing protein [Acidobacteriota bacterium]